MKKFIVMGAFIIAIGSAFTTKTSSHFQAPTTGWYNEDGVAIQGDPDQANCSGGTQVCTITDENGVAHEAYDSKPDAEAQNASGLLKFQ